MHVINCFGKTYVKDQIGYCKTDILGEYDAEFVLNNTSNQYIGFDNTIYTVKLKHTHRRLFRDSTTCVKCGIKGTVFLLEKSTHNATPLLRLYAIVDKTYKLITLDHIIPLSQGGSDGKRENQQVLCYQCNFEKGSKLPKNFKLPKKYIPAIRKILDTYDSLKYIQNNGDFGKAAIQYSFYPWLFTLRKNNGDFFYCWYNGLLRLKRINLEEFEIEE